MTVNPPQPPQQWIVPVAPPQQPVYYFPPPPMTPAPPPPRYVSGLTTGQHIRWGILTACTVGFAAPFWALAAWLGRRRIR